MAIDLNRDNYESEVLQSQEPVMVDFWGPQCKPCLALMPAVDRLEEKYNGKIKVAKVNAVENRMLCARLRVIGLPAYLFYKDGVETKRLTGEILTEKDLVAAIEETIA
ncbi:MAG: thioredoxin family protein [Dehalococcoidales bacterium]